jgi:hypothetical protein
MHDDVMSILLYDEWSRFIEDEWLKILKMYDEYYP